VGRTGTVTGFNARVELWSTKVLAAEPNKQTKDTLLATSNTIAMTSLPTTPADTEFDFPMGGRHTPTAGQEIMAVLATDIPDSFTDGRLLVGITNATPADALTLAFFGDFQDLMSALYPDNSILPTIFTARTGDTTTDNFFEVEQFALGTWTNNVAVTYDPDGDVTSLVQNWVNSEHYEDGGKIMLLWSTTDALQSNSSEHTWDFVEAATGTDTILRINFTPPKRS
jgi:hypothetical protein